MGILWVGPAGNQKKMYKNVITNVQTYDFPNNVGNFGNQKPIQRVQPQPSSSLNNNNNTFGAKVIIIIIIIIIITTIIIISKSNQNKNMRVDTTTTTNVGKAKPTVDLKQML